MEKKSLKINGKELTLTFKKLAPQANAAVLAQMGETIILCTVTSTPPSEARNYFPLFVEYQEKLYAGGKIKGSRWVKREGRPSDEATLNARLIDRSIRPLFPKGYKNEVQVVITVLSVDGENNPDVLGICAASAALSISDIPWNGPVGALRIGLKEKELFTFPTYQEQEFSDLNLVATGTEKDIIMIEAGSNEVEEEQIVKALNFANSHFKKITAFIKSLQKEFGTKKQSFKIEEIDSKQKSQIQKEAKKQVDTLINQTKDDKIDLSLLDNLKEKLTEDFDELSKKDIANTVDEYFKKQVRKNVLQKEKRIDGRKLNKVRPLSIEASVLPRTHGSAIFQRGLTQALTITTLGSPSLEQYIESMEGEETKRYIHHYYMPPYSVGETGRFGWPSRREVGHGALSERALEPVIPSEKEFPYTIRVVSEITSSNGSTSMASVCGSSLSLMDAGVPIKKPVAGIAMGLIAKTDKNNNITDYKVLTDILGLEDHLGDMDFKVAGTKDGVNAMQMDVKTRGITAEILQKGLAQAKEARLFILEKMKKTLPSAREKVSRYAPKIQVINIDPEKIGDVIGPGGKMIRQIINQTGVAMDVDDDGKVTIASKDPKGLEKAIEWVRGLTKEVKPGEMYEGKVKRILNFGAFVEILPGKQGLVHISKLADRYVKHPSDVVSEGDKVKVKVEEIDNMGRINLTMKFGKNKQKNQDNKSPKGYNYKKKY